MSGAGAPPRVPFFPGARPPSPARPGPPVAVGLSSGTARAFFVRAGLRELARAGCGRGPAQAGCAGSVGTAAHQIPAGSDPVQKPVPLAVRGFNVQLSPRSLCLGRDRFQGPELRKCRARMQGQPTVRIEYRQGGSELCRQRDSDPRSVDRAPPSVEYGGGRKACRTVEGSAVECRWGAQTPECRQRDFDP